jgi:hypothetical protein
VKISRGTVSRGSRLRWIVAGTAAAGLVATGLVTATAAHAATGCQVSYTISSQWQGGFGANVNVTNLGDPVNGWQLTWSFTAGQTITQLWNGSYTQSGSQVTVTNVSYNASIPTGGSTAFGFNGSWTGSNPVPASFSLNGVACTGSVATASPTASPSRTASPTPSPTTTSPSPTPTQSSGGGTLPSSFRWSSSGALMSPKSNSTHNLLAVKDPSVVRFNGTYYVLMSTVDSNGNYNMAQASFTDWSQAGSAPLFYLDQTPIGTGYKTAPMVFYFAPQKLWYLTYQTGGNMAYSTNPDISNPAGWSAPHNFYSNGTPSIIQQNIGSGFWVDSWVICDSANCYLFSADDNGHIYRSTSSLSQFPNGFGDGSNTVIAITGNRNQIFEAENVYKVDGSNTYLLVVEAFGSSGRRVFNSWTASSLTGSWTPLATPFLAASNATFSGTAWTQDFSSGEAIRSNFDQTVTLSPCHLQYAYQGLDPSASGDYNHLPWRIGLATQTNSTC